MSPMDFFEEQLDLCKQMIDCNGASHALVRDNDLGIIASAETRARFKEHPRCTARFGEVLMHARDNCASTQDEEYQKAIYNAQSIVNYVDACRNNYNSINGNGAYPIREGLIGDIAAALTTQSLQNFRVRQIQDGFQDAVASRKKLDFTLEQADLEILGRLYYSAIRSNAQYLDEVGLTPDHGSFTALLALCRAASAESASSNLPHNSIPMLSNDGAKLDAALTNHFNGITASGCRFLFSPQHGIAKHKSGGGIRRSSRLIIAFSSLGNGLVRHEFGGSLAKINNQLYASDDTISVFDVLFVADPSQSWYQKDSRGTFVGFEEYEQRIRVASRPYDEVSIVGDSMGGSAALLFSHLATESVVAFSPQVDLEGDGHVSRHDMTPFIRDRYRKRLLCSVKEALAQVKIFVHRGVEEADVGHTDRLLSRLSMNALDDSDPSTRRIKVVEHKECHHHQIAVHLKDQGQLTNVLNSNLIHGYNA